MPSVTIDAGVLAVPRVTASADDAVQYVETLLDWSALLREPWVAIYMSERANEALLVDGLFPFRNELKRLFTANRITQYDVNTVAQVVERLLQLTPSFEAYFSIRDVLPEELSAEPDILKLCCGAHLETDLARCIVLIAILGKLCQPPVSDHSLILRNAPDRIVRVRALVHALEHDRTDLRAVPAPPDYFEGEVVVCDSFSELIECLDESAILQVSADEVGVDMALRLALYKFRLGNGEDADWDNVPDYRVGTEFSDSFQRLHPTQQLSTRSLRAMVETLTGTNLAATHWLRSGDGANDPQRVRQSDQAKAWRRDIDRDHHLHYWQCDGGRVEFAWLGFPHDDMTIPE